MRQRVATALRSGNHSDNQHNNAYKKYENGNAVYTVHHSQIHIVFAFAKHGAWVEIMNNLFEKHMLESYM